MSSIKAVTSYWSKDDKYYIVVLPEYIDDTWVFEYNGCELTCGIPKEDSEGMDTVVVQHDECETGITLEALDYTVDEYDGLVHIRFTVAEEHPQRINKHKPTANGDAKKTPTNKSSEYSDLWKTYDELMKPFEHTPYKNPSYKYACQANDEKVDLAKTLSTFNKLFR